MSRLISVTLCLCVALCLASSARAVGFSSPYESRVMCGTTTVNTYLNFHAFQDSNQCLPLCQQAMNQCQVIVKRVISCEQFVAAKAKAFKQKNCTEEDPAGPDRKLCQENAKQELSDDLLDIQTDRDSGLAGCASWHATCVSWCPGQP